jgi:hypothetical protein
MKTVKEIADALIAAPHLTDDALADLYEYRREKRATGAPTDLESAVIHAAKECQDAADALVKHLDKAAKEATANAAHLAQYGVRFGEQTWFVLDGRTSAEQLNRALRAKREQFQALVVTWAAVADRIVATPEDIARRVEEQRAQWVAAWESRTVRDLRAAAKKSGLNVGTDRAEIARALVDAGVEP